MLRLALRTYWIRAVIVAVIVGLLAFSMQWPKMPVALYVGLGVALAALAGAFVARRALSRAGGARGGAESRR